MKKINDTQSFHFYNANPKNKRTEDCVFRAISLTLDMSWKDVVMEMAEMSCKTGYAITGNKLIEKYLLSKGWIKQKQKRTSDNKKINGKEFCKLFSKNDVVIVKIGSHHLSCIKENKIWDTWDCSPYKVGVYYIK